MLHVSATILALLALLAAPGAIADPIHCDGTLCLEARGSEHGEGSCDGSDTSYGAFWQASAQANVAGKEVRAWLRDSCYAWSAQGWSTQGSTFAAYAGVEDDDTGERTWATISWYGNDGSDGSRFCGTYVYARDDTAGGVVYEQLPCVTRPPTILTRSV